MGSVDTTVDDSTSYLSAVILGLYSYCVTIARVEDSKVFYDATLWYVGNFSPDDTASHPKGLGNWAPSLWESQNSGYAIDI